MKSTSVGPGGIADQVLSKDNYKRWRIVMQNYLEGQGLWDVVIQSPPHPEDNENNDANLKKTKDAAKAFHFFQLSRGRELLFEKTGHQKPLNHLTPQNGIDHSIVTPDIEQGLWGVVQSVSEVEPNASWKMKDKKALHIIQLSCGREIVDEISHFKTAKDAWNHLSNLYGNELKAGLDIDQAISGDSLGQQHKELFRMVARGDDIGNIIMDSDICITSGLGRTLLHVAVITGNVRNVAKLVKQGKKRLLVMQDQRGYTALALVTRYTGNTDIAKCMVESENGKSLLTMQNKNVEIPVLLAAANGHKEMATYLYSETPLRVFEEDSRNRVLLLWLCITAEIFDVALRLLKRYPNLARESLFSKFSIPELLRDSLSLPSKIPKLDSLKESLPDKFSPLEALAKMSSAFPSGSRFSRREKFIYNILSIEKQFRDKYDIPDIANFVQSVTRVAAVDDESRQKTFFATLCGWFCNSNKLVLNFLFLPVKLLGLLLRGITYLFVQIFKCLNIFGIKKIYDKKFTHYEVIGILYYYYQSIAEFNHLQLVEASAYEAMLHAAQHGIVEFINAMREANPDMLLAVDSCRRGIFSYAIQHRKQNVFQLIHYLEGRKEIFRYRVDMFGNNLLHLAAQLGPSSDRDTRSGAALQMQREFQWFKAVEKVVHPKYKEAKNCDGKKPYELFTENHDQLVKEGEKWAKDTATSFTIVGSLITTMMFAAAFTVPGGNNQDTGSPIFLHSSIFTIFLIADAISLFTSATSVLIFIGILTSRYAEKDFLRSLPWKLLLGLFFLFLSVCSMIVAFCAAINMIFMGYQSSKWVILGPTMSLGSIPVIVLVVSQLHLMYEIFHSTLRNPISSIEN